LERVLHLLGGDQNFKRMKSRILVTKKQRELRNKKKNDVRESDNKETMWGRNKTGKVQSVQVMKGGNRGSFENWQNNFKQGTWGAGGTKSQN